LLIEPFIRIQALIAVEKSGIPMPLVRAAFCGDRDLATGSFAVFRLII
jgi:hypothetical protein